MSFKPFSNIAQVPPVPTVVRSSCETIMKLQGRCILLEARLNQSTAAILGVVDSLDHMPETAALFRGVIASNERVMEQVKD